MKRETVIIDGREIPTLRLGKRDTVDISKLVREGYSHIVRNFSAKQKRDGGISGITLFVKLNKRNQVVGMRPMPFEISAQ